MWKAKLKDGKEVSELNTKWNEVENDVTELMLITKDNKTICLPRGLNKYVQSKTGSCEMNSNNIQIESRNLGFVLGSNIVKIKVNEKTGNINVEIEEVHNP
jgi:hypothetical protein